MPASKPLQGHLEPIERASQDELRALQLQHLKWSLHHAYDNVPHYKRCFDAAGAHPDDLRSLADLAQFPLTTKHDLREAIDAVDIYGLSEVMGPRVANECIETKDGPVIWEDHFYPEIIDPDSGKVLADGEFGELVFTSLGKQALPVIRYRTRDLTRLLPPTARSMRRMARIVGRSDDMLIIRGVNVFPTQIEELILKMPALAPHYVLEVTRENHLDAMTVHVESATGAQSSLSHEAAARELIHSVKSYVGISVQVQVGAPGYIERSIGKAKRVIDRRAALS